jgi:hypothetical protein
LAGIALVAGATPGAQKAPLPLAVGGNDGMVPEPAWRTSGVGTDLGGPDRVAEQDGIPGRLLGERVGQPGPGDLPSPQWDPRPSSRSSQGRGQVDGRSRSRGRSRGRSRVRTPPRRAPAPRTPRTRPSSQARPSKPRSEAELEAELEADRLKLIAELEADRLKLIAKLEADRLKLIAKLEADRANSAPAAVQEAPTDEASFIELLRQFRDKKEEDYGTDVQ